jgi:hypothetical protein
VAFHQDKLELFEASRRPSSGRGRPGIGRDPSGSPGVLGPKQKQVGRTAKALLDAANEGVTSGNGPFVKPYVNAL